MSKLALIADRVLNRPLMIMPEKLSLIASVLDGKIGIDASSLAADFESELAKAAPDASRFVGKFELADPSDPKSRKAYRTTDEGIAIINVFGSLVNRGAFIGSYSGMTSYEGLKHQISSAAADPDVRAIVLDIDSPGGEAVGAFEVADVVRAAADRKQVTACVNGMACSAAYAIASGAPRIVTTASGISGSIGVVMMHADYSNKLHQAGIVPTMIFAGARKVDGNPYEKLSAEVKGELSAEINRFYDLFVASVATGRQGMTIDAIRATEARTYIGADAVSIGLADAVGSFESVLSDLTGHSAPIIRNKQQGLNMSKEVPEGSISLAAHNAAVNLAVSDATASMKADLDKAKASASTAVAEATKAANDRVKAIFGLVETKGREAQAVHVITATAMDADAAKEFLAGIPLSTGGARAGDANGGLVISNDDPKTPAADNYGWDSVTADLNKKVAR